LSYNKKAREEKKRKSGRLLRLPRTREGEREGGTVLLPNSGEKNEQTVLGRGGKRSAAKDTRKGRGVLAGGLVKGGTLRKSFLRTTVRKFT